MAFDETGRSHSYHILQSPLPQQGCLSTLRVRETGDGQRSRVDWYGEFQPVGVGDAEISKLFQGIYEDGLAALRKRYADKG